MGKGTFFFFKLNVFCCQQLYLGYIKDVDAPIVLGISSSPYQTVAGVVAILFFSNSKVVFCLTFFSTFFLPSLKSFLPLLFLLPIPLLLSIFTCELICLHHLPHFCFSPTISSSVCNPSLYVHGGSPVVFFSGWWRVDGGGGWR